MDLCETLGGKANNRERDHDTHDHVTHGAVVLIANALAALVVAGEKIRFRSWSRYGFGSGSPLGPNDRTPVSGGACT